MNIVKELKKYEKYYPIEIIDNHLKTFSVICSEKIQEIIPSIIIGTDGPVLSSLFMITENYLCEFHLGMDILCQDFVHKKLIFNFRIEQSEFLVEQGSGDKINYQIAKVTLLHDVAGFKTSMNYAGNERDEWLRKIINVFPLSFLIR